MLFFSAVQEGTVMVDSSTIDPSVAKEVAKVSAEKGAVYMDAPVSGGTVLSTLTFLHPSSF